MVFSISFAQQPKHVRELLHSNYDFYTRASIIFLTGVWLCQTFVHCLFIVEISLYSDARYRIKQQTSGEQDHNV